MNRRTFLCWLTLGTLAAPLGCESQQKVKVPRVGVLFPIEPSSSADPSVAAFQGALRQLGYLEGKTIAVEYRHPLGRTERLPELVGELVRLKVDVMVVGSVPATRAAKDATQTIPIVFLASDPVGSGLVPSLARPGGNVTGLSFAYDQGFAGKWVQLLKEATPKVSRAGVLRDPANPASATFLKDMRVTAQALGLQLELFEVSQPEQLDSALAAMTGLNVRALIVEPSTLFLTLRGLVVSHAAKHRLPAVYGLRHFVDDGGLMSYGISIPDLWRRAAAYVDKILKGAKPADLPVEQPTKFELVINLKTAKALGLTIPQTLRLRADQVIE